MHEIVDQVLNYVRGIWRHRWYALGLTWLVCVAGWIWAYQLPDQYEASARVYVDTQSVLRPVLKGLTIGFNPGSQIGLMTRTLLTRPNLEKVARMTDLDLNASNDAALDQVIASLGKKVRLGAAGRENLYSISYRDEDPQLAKRVVQALLTIFVENTLGETRQDSDTAQRFLEKQITDYENRLLAAENRLKEFKRQNMGVMPSEGRGYYEELKRVTDLIEAAQLELHQAENRRASLERQLRGEEPTFGVGPEPAIESPHAPLLAERLPIQQRINSLQQQLDNLLLRYTERHPDVIALRQTLDELGKQRDVELAEMTQRLAQLPAASMSGLEMLDANPVFQNLKIAIGREETNIASLQVKVAEYEKRLQDLQGKVNTVLEVEGQMKALDRDYSVTRQNYEQLLARRESVHISQQVDQTTDNIRFKVIEPPRVPTQPSGPDRARLMSMVLIGGLAAGLGLAFLLAQLRPTFDTRHGLMQATNLPVLGCVDMIMAPHLVRRERLGMVAFVFCGICLLAAYSGLLLLQQTELRLPWI